MRYDSLHHQAGVEGFLSGYGSPGRARVHAAGVFLCSHNENSHLTQQTNANSPWLVDR
jgi:hypothetical protein